MADTLKQTPEPTVFNLTINHSLDSGIEAIVWPDGSISLPVKRLAQLLELSPQESEPTKTIFYSDPYLKQSCEINWQMQTIQQGGQNLPLKAHPMKMKRIENKNSWIKPEVFIDKPTLEILFNVTMTVDLENSTIDLETERPLKELNSSQTLIDNPHEDKYQVIANPNIINSPVERIYISQSSFSNYQTVHQPNLLTTVNTQGISNSLNTGVQGTLLGNVSYYVKPSFIRYNGKTNIQSVDWLFHKENEQFDWKLGSFDAGLSALVSPTLPLWGFKFASKNASGSKISPLPYRHYHVKRNVKNSELELVLNDKKVQSISAKQNLDEFEPLYLVPQNVNNIEVKEKTPNQEETLILHESVTYYPNVLTQGEKAYSAFFGRAPLQFEPILLDQQTPVLMPQSEKWLTGGRFYYGLTDKLTVGISTASSMIFSKPRTFFLNQNPFSQDLTGFVSYQRDPNFFEGSGAALSAQYQLNNRWSLLSDIGSSLYHLKSGSYLTTLPKKHSAEAGKVALQYQGKLYNAEINAFHYDTFYYSPDSIFNSYMYDKEGIGGTISGVMQPLKNTHYQVRWDKYITNLDNLLSGGLINANHWKASSQSSLSAKNTLSFNMDWTEGHNKDKQLSQRFADVSLDRKIKKDLKAQIRLTDQLTNFILLPSGGVSTMSLYENNGVETSLDKLFGKSLDNHIQVGHLFSTFVNYVFVKSTFHYKHAFTELSVQKSYGDKQQILDNIGIRLGYQFPSGRKVSFSYWILNNDIHFLNLAPTRVNTHQFFFDFTDVIGMVADHFHSVGQQGDNLATVSGRVFVDLNQNGKFDSNEPGVKNVSLLLDNSKTITTDSEGKYIANGLVSGFHTLELQPEKLPVLLDAENMAYKIKVLEAKNQRLNIALIPQGGSVTGKILVKNIDNKVITGDKVLLVIRNHQGEIVNYTSSEPDGTYRFANLSPDEYQIDIESKLKESGTYKVLSPMLKAVIEPPKKYDEALRLEGYNFNLLKLE